MKNATKSPKSDQDTSHLFHPICLFDFFPSWKRYLIYTAILFTLPVMHFTAYAEEGAQNSDNTKKNSNQKKKDAKSNDEMHSNTSAAMRKQSKIGFEPLFTPASDFAFKFGVQGYYQFGSKWQFGGLVLYGTNSPSLTQEPGVIINSTSVTGTALLGYVRYFTGNSFSIASGLGYRSGAGSISTSDTMGDNFSWNFTATSIVLPLAIGNHWAFKNGLTIGCDWIMIMLPISGSSTSTISLSNNTPQAVQDLSTTFADAGTALAKANSVTLGLFSVGFLF